MGGCGARARFGELLPAMVDGRRIHRQENQNREESDEEVTAAISFLLTSISHYL